MAELTLQNESIQLTVAEHGAEIRSLVRKSDGREMMWQADPAYWGRTSPVLFPLVGQYWKQTSFYDGREYRMSQHGFARDMNFVPVQDRTEGNELWFALTDSEATHEKYPFAFRLEVGYRLEKNAVTVCWRVQNTDERKMYFSIGGHPAFCCDLNRSYLAFEQSGQNVTKDMICNIIAGDGSGCLSDRQKKLALSEGKLALSDALFEEDALIVENRQADAVTLLDAGQNRLLTVRFDAPLFGIWSPVGKHAPFVCIEPWYGRCDRVGFAQKLEEREYGNALDPGEKFEVYYQVVVH